MLNKGKIINYDDVSGHPVAISYGDHSPSDDPVRLQWRIGDRRYPVGPSISPTAMGWVCISSGTPGTWVQIKINDPQLIYSQDYRFNGFLSGAGETAFTGYSNDQWTLAGNYIFLAQSGIDIRGHEYSTSPVTPIDNLSPIPESGAEIIAVHAYFNLNSFPNPTPNNLQIILYNQNGNTLTPGGIGVDTGVLGGVTIYRGPPLIPMMEGDGMALMMLSQVPAGTGELNVSFKVSAYKTTIL